MKRIAFSCAAVSAFCVMFMALAATRYVDLNNPSPASPYTSWTTAATNIQDAVDAAVDGDEIVVTNGVYATGGRAVYGTITNRLAITKAVSVRSVNGPSLTLIQGLGVGTGATNNGDGAIRCVYVGTNAVLSGFTLTNGHTRQAGDTYKEQSGGGAWCELSGVVSSCTLIGNSANMFGGGAIYGTLNNCALSMNSAVYGGGAVGSTLNNSTLGGNSAYVYGGGASHSTLTNCIVYYNSAPNGSNSDASAFNYSCTTPPPRGPGNIPNAPRFVNTNGWSNLRLQSNSPCINAGGNAYAPGLTDLDGNPRISGGAVDMGAYEIQNPASVISYAWLQSYGFPTDGSADFADTDHDGMNNWQEWVAGTNPTNAASVLRMLSGNPGASNVVVTWASVSNRTYSLARATNLLAAPVFSVLRSNIAGLAGTTSFTDPNRPAGSAAFYRVAVQLP